MRENVCSRRGFFTFVVGATLAFAAAPAMLGGCGGDMSGTAGRSGPLGPILKELGLANHFWEFYGESISGQVVSYDPDVVDLMVSVNDREIASGVANYTVRAGDRVSVTLV
ncbi:MAG: hypothetical protein AAB348_00175 [Patescibacteria group bacterium]